MELEKQVSSEPSCRRAEVARRAHEKRHDLLMKDRLCVAPRYQASWKQIAYKTLWGGRQYFPVHHKLSKVRLTRLDRVYRYFFE